MPGKSWENKMGENTHQDQAEAQNQDNEITSQDRVTLRLSVAQIDLAYWRSKLSDDAIGSMLQRTIDRVMLSREGDNVVRLCVGPKTRIQAYKDLEGAVWVIWKEVCRLAEIHAIYSHGASIEKQRKLIEDTSKSALFVRPTHCYPFLLARRAFATEAQDTIRELRKIMDLAHRNQLD